MNRTGYGRAGAYGQLGTLVVPVLLFITGAVVGRALVADVEPPVPGLITGQSLFAGSVPLLLIGTFIAAPLPPFAGHAGTSANVAGGTFAGPGVVMLAGTVLPVDQGRSQADVVLTSFQGDAGATGG